MNAKADVHVVAIVIASAAFAQTDPPSGRVEQFRIGISTNAHVETGAYNVPAQLQNSETRASASSTGSERSQCSSSEQNQSVGRAEAEARMLDRTPSAFRASLLANSAARGGHFMRCGGCILNTCLGVSGEDTSGTAKANTRLVARVVFDDDARAILYDLAIDLSTSGSTDASTFEVRDSSDRVLLDAQSARNRIQVEGRPGAVYTVIATTKAEAIAGGAAGARSEANEADLEIRMTRSPIISSSRTSEGGVLTSSGERRRIIGGKETKTFPAVGALLLDGAMHCTGTLIREATVLTAAHCIYNYPLDEMTFVQGWNVAAPDASYRVNAAHIPDGSVPGFRYDDKTLEDDIAIIKLKDSGTQFLPLFAGLPDLPTHVSEKRPVIFVGFGYEKVAGELVNAGLKRQVEMPVEVLQGRTFRYKTPGANTCYGDSGGPALITDRNQILVLGVTSRGDKDCAEYGVDVRVDAYQAWLDSLQ